MDRSRALRRVAVGAGLATAAGAVSVSLAHRRATKRWLDEHDPSGPVIGHLPSGERFTVTTDDGAVLDGIILGVRGSGAPLVVFSHCWTGNRYVWAPVARRLVDDGYQVVLYDQRGHGVSTLGAAELSVSRLGDDLRHVLEAVDARDAVVVGHSMGGMTAQSFAIEHGDAAAERIKAMVLVATAAHHDLPAGLTSLLQTVTRHRLTNPVLTGALGPALVRFTVGHRPRLSHLDATRAYFVATPEEVRTDLLIAMSEMDLRPGLPTIEVPTTVVVGGRDLLTPAPLGRAIAAGIPGSRVVEVPRGGHMLPFEVPDLLARLVAEAHGDAAGTTNAA